MRRSCPKGRGEWRGLGLVLGVCLTGALALKWYSGSRSFERQRRLHELDDQPACEAANYLLKTYPAFAEHGCSRDGGVCVLSMLPQFGPVTCSDRKVVALVSASRPRGVCRAPRLEQTDAGWALLLDEWADVSPDGGVGYLKREVPPVLLGRERQRLLFDEDPPLPVRVVRELYEMDPDACAGAPMTTECALAEIIVGHGARDGGSLDGEFSRLSLLNDGPVEVVFDELFEDGGVGELRHPLPCDHGTYDVVPRGKPFEKGVRMVVTIVPYRGGVAYGAAFVDARAGTLLMGNHSGVVIETEEGLRRAQELEGSADEYLRRRLSGEASP